MGSCKTDLRVDLESRLLINESYAFCPPIQLRNRELWHTGVEGDGDFPSLCPFVEGIFLQPSDVIERSLDPIKELES